MRDHAFWRWPSQHLQSHTLLCNATVSLCTESELQVSVPLCLCGPCDYSAQWNTTEMIGCKLKRTLSLALWLLFPVTRQETTVRCVNSLILPCCGKSRPRGKVPGRQASWLKSGRVRETARGPKASDMGGKRLSWKLILNSGPIHWYLTEHNQGFSQSS